METLEKKINKFRKVEKIYRRLALGTSTLSPRKQDTVFALVVYKLILGEGYNKDNILEKIIDYSGVSMEDFGFGEKNSKLNLLRQVAYHAHKCLGVSFYRAGLMVSYKDRSLAIYGCGIIDRSIAKYKEFVDLAFRDRLPTKEEIYRALRYNK